jgi:hypothetical protein
MASLLTPVTSAGCSWDSPACARLPDSLWLDGGGLLHMQSTNSNRRYLLARDLLTECLREFQRAPRCEVATGRLLCGLRSNIPAAASAMPAPRLHRRTALLGAGNR